MPCTANSQFRRVRKRLSVRLGTSVRMGNGHLFLKPAETCPSVQRTLVLQSDGELFFSPADIRSCDGRRKNRTYKTRRMNARKSFKYKALHVYKVYYRL